MRKANKNLYLQRTRTATENTAVSECEKSNEKLNEKKNELKSKEE